MGSYSQMIDYVNRLNKLSRLVVIDGVEIHRGCVEHRFGWERKRRSDRRGVCRAGCRARDLGAAHCPPVDAGAGGRASRAAAGGTVPQPAGESAARRPERLVTPDRAAPLPYNRRTRYRWRRGVAVPDRGRVARTGARRHRRGPARRPADPDRRHRGELARRRLGYGRGPRMRFERDDVDFLGGVRHGRTLGSPVAIEITQQRVGHRQVGRGDVVGAGRHRRKPLTQPRPGHADLAGMQKYGFTDARDVLERASARETARTRGRRCGRQSRCSPSSASRCCRT